MQNTIHTSSELVALPQANDVQFNAALRTISIADDYVIDSADMYELAGAELVDFKRVYNELEARRVSITGPLNEALKNANALFRPVMDRVESASKLIASRMRAWSDAEKARIAAENAAREKLAREERERLERQAREAANEGRAEEAFALAQTAQLVVAPAQSVAAPKLAGVSSRANWSAECTDLAALIRFVAQRPEYTNLLMANQSALTQMAKAQKAAMKVDGVRVWDKGTTAIRI